MFAELALPYDQPLYRPPSEGRNLIIQATIGCSFNRCTFCSMYKTKWVSLSFPQFGEIGGNAGFDDGVVGGRSDGRRLLDEAVEQESTGL